MRRGIFCGLCLLTTITQAAGPDPQAAQKKIEELGGRLYKDRAGQVESIHLKGPNMTDDHLALLLAFPSVRKVNLNDSEITEDGLQTLLQLENLEEVNVERTRVTEKAAEAFKKKHPKVYFVSHEPRFKPFRLVFSGVFLLPILSGVWLVRMARKKKPHLTDLGFLNVNLLGIFLIAVCGLLMIINILQAVGMTINVSNLFG